MPFKERAAIVGLPRAGIGGISLSLEYLHISVKVKVDFKNNWRGDVLLVQLTLLGCCATAIDDLRYSGNL